MIRHFVSGKDSKHRVSQLLIFSLITLLFSCGEPPAEEKEDQFSMHIRTSEPRTPEEERSGFKLPEGFKIEIFASEPDIGKPMNISFDARGRMWVTQSNDYPFYDSTGTGPDRISILEDTDQDGKADKITTFADSLNIPIGITPVLDGAIAYSIPYVYHLTDPNQDDKVDQRKILLRGFEYKDTHGMINNFYRGLDGWIHADHGFSNISNVVGTDENEPLVMQSGNTFRFRPDGTGVEFTTTGRVNPFGYAMDKYGYMYSVDCHSSPIYQLIRGADYPHFGKKPTGIGFGPYMMRHEYGSTALAGLEYYTGNQFPEEFRQNFYLGDVVKCRVYRNSIEMNGTTPVPTWEPDFVTSEDPWFRPVDVKLGPDGALYIADFYNSIIGHYEVPLDHPARDKRRGRIWRITYEPNAEMHVAKDWTKMDISGLIKGLDEPNQNVRRMVADQLVDRFGTKAIPEVLSLVNSDQATENELVHGMWILFRLDTLSDELLINGLAHTNDVVNVHTLTIMFEMESLSLEMLTIATEMLQSNNAHIKRAVTMLLARYPATGQVKTLLALRNATSPEDTHFYYVIRQALRDHMRDDRVRNYTVQNEWVETDSRSIADVMMGVDDSEAAVFMLNHIRRYEEPNEIILKYTTHISRYLPNAEMDLLVETLKDIFKDDLDLQYQAFLAMQRGVAQAGKSIEGKGKNRAIELASTFLSMVPDKDSWKVTPLNNSYNANPWIYDNFDEFPGTDFLISGPKRGRGMTNTQLKSPQFEFPGQLTFTLVGHKTPPSDDGILSPTTNRIELFIDDNENPEYTVEIEKANVQEKITWELSAHKGKSGYILITDGSSEWGEFIGIGHLEAPPLPEQSLNQMTERQVFACEVAGDYKVQSMLPDLKALILSDRADVLVRSAAASAALEISSDNVNEIERVIHEFDESEVLRRALLLSLGKVQTSKSFQIIHSVLDSLSFELQKEVVLMMANHPEGIDAVFKAAGDLDISPRILLDPQINERLTVNMTDTQKIRLSELTTGITPFSEEIRELIETRISKYSTAKTSVQVGEGVFQQNCSVCHQVGGQGGNIGPQLDGIGNWGLKALSEKILDPNRNISKAFVNYKIELKDGRILQGLFRRQEGKVKVFADMAGKEFSVPESEIESMDALPFTLMPDSFAHVISEEDYYHLMSYLLSKN